MVIHLSELTGKRVFVTGHTGFKGSWLCRILSKFGADVYGYSLEPLTNPNLYTEAGIEKHIQSEIGDIRDLDHLLDYYEHVKPEIVFHLAAQPIVKIGYTDPVGTYSSNVMGTVNILECERIVGCAKSLINVTTDKVYYNDESGNCMVEEQVLDGFDPYSNSKSCSELVTATYRRSFSMNCKISSVRAGNVIGGGDYAPDRIIPDCIRASSTHSCIFIRNPNSIRPYQHVLEPLFAYISIGLKQIESSDYSGSYNVGPEKEDCITTGKLADLFCNYWGEDSKWITGITSGPHESNYLRLDNSKLKQKIGIRPHWTIDDAVKKTVEFVKLCESGKNTWDVMGAQIEDYLKGNNQYKL